MEVFGATRSCVRPDHALITPDTHVPAPLPGWENATAVVHISPHLGARFSQYTAKLESAARCGPPTDGIERFVYVHTGSVDVRTETSATQSLGAGEFAFFPTGIMHEISSPEHATLIVFEKRYQPQSGVARPGVVIGRESEAESVPFQGDPDALLQTLLPDCPEFDMAVNLFTYQPGATLPQVEIHVMEHGLIMLDGAGVYRLGECWHPVTAGDVIWMKSYCPQWFVAMGTTQARYLYYKDVNRSPLDEAL